MVKHFLISFVLLCASTNLYASAMGDAAPESDVGLSAESLPEDGKLKIPEVSFPVFNGEPVIDGDINDDFWKQAKSFSLETELYPTRHAPAVVETKAWLAVTSTHIYVAFDASDPNPKNMRSALRERDASKEDDYVSLVIDPTGTLAKKYEFRVNPHGTLSDVIQDTISDRYIYDWDTEWDGAAKIYDKGFTVEMAIPIGSIRLPVKDKNSVHKGAVILKRSYPRRVDRTLATFFIYTLEDDDETQDTATEIKKDGSQQTTEKAKAAAAIAAKEPAEITDKQVTTAPEKSSVQLGIAKGYQVEVASMKAATAASSRSVRKNQQLSKVNYTPHYIYHLDEKRKIGGTFEQVDEHKIHELGIDIDYQINSAQTLSLTVNPSYTDVESDIARQSINNPFVIFKPEKRRFFKTSTEYYNTLIPTVYTRNLIQPEWGATYIRDDIYSSFGAFGVNDKETEVIIPDTFGSDEVELLETSKSAAVRYRYSKDRRTFGLVGTLRTAEGYHNALAGIDGLWDISIDDKLRYQFLYSDTKYPQRFAEDLCEEDDCTTVAPPADCPLGNCSVNAQVLRTEYDKPLTGYALKLKYKHDGPQSLYWVNYEDFSPDFRADLGYQKRVDIRTINMAYGRKWYVDTFINDKGKSRIRGYLVYTHSRSHEQNHQVDDAISAWAEFRGSYQSVLRVGKRYNEKAVNRINQNSLDTGSNAPLFDEDYWQWYLETSPWANWTLNLDGRWGEIADADNLVLGDMKELKPKVSFRMENWQFILQTTYRDFEVNNSRLYKENFVSFTTQYRKNSQVSHRLLYLNDLTKRDTDRWLSPELAKEVNETFEYTFIYKPTKKLKILAGYKAEYDFESDINDGGLTNREFYTKIEQRF